MDRIYVMKLVQAFQSGGIDRRTFLKRATLAVGSLAAAKLLAACGAPVAETEPSPVVEEGATSAPPADETHEGLTTGMVSYPGPEGAELMGYLARPDDTSEALPAIIVIQEWWGLNEHIRDVTRRFARQGFVALAPDLYDGQVTTEPDEARKLVMELDMMQAVREIGAAIDHALDQDYTSGSEAGIVGFCMGGRLVLQTVVADEDVGAAVAFYGSPLTPEEAPNANAPVLGLYGSDDQSIPVEEVRQMEEAFADADITHDIQVYEGAGHAFFNDTRDSYDEAAASDAWPRTLEWFRTHL
jgi:carboxymethylenebutenolidase